MSALPLDLVPAPDEPPARPRPSTIGAWRGPRNPWDDPTFRPEERGAARARQRARVEEIQARAIAQDAGRDEEGDGIGAGLAAEALTEPPEPPESLSALARLRARFGGRNMTHHLRRIFTTGGSASPPDLRPCGCERRRPHRSTCRLSCSAGVAEGPAEVPSIPETTEMKEDPMSTTTTAAPAAPAAPAEGKRPCGCGRFQHSPKVCALMSPEERATKLEAMRARARAAGACPKRPRESKAPSPAAPAADRAAEVPAAPAPAGSITAPSPGSITATVGAVTFAFSDAASAAAFARALASAGDPARAR